MACKLKCPHCGLVLKERGDLGKKAQGEYIVVGGVGPKIQCVPCGWIDKTAHFDELLSGPPRR